MTGADDLVTYHALGDAPYALGRGPDHGQLRLRMLDPHGSSVRVLVYEDGREAILYPTLRWETDG